MAQSQKLSEEQEFEKKLFYSLKRYGYLFPENKQDIEKLEELYGDTEIEIPAHLQNLNVPKADEELPSDFDVDYRVAAFSSKEPGSFELPEDEEDPEV